MTQAAHAGAAPGEGRASRILLLALLGLNILNFVDRQLLQAFVVDVRRDLDLSYTQFTLLAGIIFSAANVVAGLVMGVLADRMARQKLLAAGLCLWSAMTALSGLTRGFWDLAAARAMVAAGESSLAPAGLSMLSDAYRPEVQGRVTGIYYLGIPIGAGGALLIAGTIGAALGWRGTFILMGALGVLAAGAVLLLRDPPRRGHGGPSGELSLEMLPAIRAAGSAIASTPALWMTLAGAVLLVFANGALVLDQAWLVGERGYEVAQAQQIFGLIFLCGGVVGAFLGGWLSDLFNRKRAGGRQLFLAVAILATAPALLGYRLLPADSPIFYLSAFVVSATVLLPFGPVLSEIAALAPARLKATVIAISILAINGVGIAIGSLTAGGLTDRLTSAGIDQPLTWALLATGSVGLLAVPLFLAAYRIHPGTNR
jgi:MFS family permease